MFKSLKKIVGIFCFLPGIALASDSNPFDLWGISSAITDAGGLLPWFQQQLTGEYFPIILGSVGLLTFVACGAHIYTGLKKARSEEGSAGAMTEHFTLPILGCVLGLALVGVAWSIMNSMANAAS